MKRFSDLSILVVENNDHMRTILNRVLTAFGVARVIEAEDALTAYLLMCCERIDLVILDYFLRERTGADFVRLLRRDAACPNRTTPVVVLTALPAHARAEGIVEAGAQAVISKPITPREFYRDLVDVLARDAAAADRYERRPIQPRPIAKTWRTPRVPAPH